MQKIDRMERRREQNRQAAKRSRERRQKEVNYLQDTVNDLLDQNRRLESENVQLKQMVAEMRKLIPASSNAALLLSAVSVSEGPSASNSKDTGEKVKSSDSSSTISSIPPET